LTKCSAAALDGVPDGAQQHVVAEWLRQELDSSRLHGLDRHRNVAVTRDEDDRHVHPIDSDALLQIETIEVRRVTSSTRQLGARTRGRDRNSCADANVSGCQPSQRMSASSDSRTETSSSTTNTIGVVSDMGADLDLWSSALDNLI
jgi:hypothetical protein